MQAASFLFSNPNSSLHIWYIGTHWNPEQEICIRVWSGVENLEYPPQQVRKQAMICTNALKAGIRRHMPIVSCVFKTNMNVYLLRSTICSNIYLYVHTCIPRYEHWYACKEVYCTTPTNMRYMNVLMYWCRSSQPRAPSLPGADLGSGTHHATTLAILSHCQHADLMLMVLIMLMQ